MSLPPQPKANPKRTGKRISFFNDQGLAKKDSAAEGSFYDLENPSMESVHSDVPGQASHSEGSHVYNSVIFSPDKGEQRRGHYQQTVPIKWTQPDSSRQPGWTRGVPINSWSQNIASYLGGINMNESRMQPAYPESLLEEPLQQQQRGAAEKQLANSLNTYRDSAKALGVEWEQQQAVASLQHVPVQQGHATVLQSQSLAVSRAATSSVLQPFQVAFGQPKQPLSHGFYQVFQDSRTLPNLNYSGQPKFQNQFQQQELLQNQQLHQRQRQIPHKQQEMQEDQQFLSYFPGTSLPSAHTNPHPQQQPPQALGSHTVAHEPASQPPAECLDSDVQKFSSNPQLPSEEPQPAPRRSRRLSKEGAPAAAAMPGNRPAHGTQGSLNGNAEGVKVLMEEEMQAAAVGVIKSTHRKRRASQEVNLETLAQKASEMESLPSHSMTQEQEKVWNSSTAPQGPDRRIAEDEWASAKRSREESMLPLVLPVSVPVRRADQEPAKPPSGWTQRPLHEPVQCERKPSVIVTRRRSLRSSLSESTGQNGEGEGGKDDDGKAAKTRRRPRPEPLFIPSPKTGTFIAPPVYSNVTPYQSHLRSPVRLADTPITLPPYTPPPILSPVREGSGLYFSTFMSSGVANAPCLGPPPPATPKSASRSLLRSSSCDITPPLLCAVNEATPVSIEPRINIGNRHQAEVPELRVRAAAHQDEHRAELVWAPQHELESTHPARVDDLMHLACSSVFPGGGTNQELALHGLYECKGDVLETLTLLLLQKPMFTKTHPLADYHYSGCDSWTSAERRLFNKGIATYKKDFFMVQKIVSTKTVAQCVEFYYTYKKQVKIGRSGTLVYGDLEPPETWAAEVELDVRSSQQLKPMKVEEGKNWEESCDRKQACSPARVTQLLQVSENDGALLVYKSLQEKMEVEPSQIRPLNPRPAPKKPSADSGKKTAPGAAKGPEGEFPCKKCGRVFYKVKSRSAHMKSHAEQEKKAAALRQREAEQRAAAAIAAVAAATAGQNGTREHGGDAGGDSSDESSVEGEDADDEDWH
uniref:Mitotic deacetylase associated SANT domain protein n=1 Tax=Paramormyrops kingsleyae TaxID=1676925 RepID=A0A3B3SAC3_9TELE|nr:ELM2 and SANT domain-containing protein 1-like isoform X1 [Paramormyrops kingsleyae]XP_023683196.1 ELM2 and SANT domain-containing protein 1-like isoform X1 [Paramormyrops kingsleyae]XP_023683197.1 ELM2 and SANT domain-containing protein 1-like isoform X1 [Paramormyrops kingsleyae]